MLFTLKELVRWFGMTALEIFMHLVSVFIFTIVAVLRNEGVITKSWWYVFIPLFMCDGACAYLCFIIFVRTYRTMPPMRGQGGIRFLSSLICITLTFVFKVLLCQRLTGENQLTFSEVLTPIFILLQILVVHGCRTN
ncbi:transmembrane protein 203-like [Tubulanus polymorphus]|uniref:transmembrane protein 203-like n=1 Tax=Tubulanus polymorphus TaxID=672921 RepID=UPI003DA64E06